MKKVISLLLALVMCLSLAACGGGKDSGSSSGGSSSGGTSAPAPSTPDPAPAPEPAGASEDSYANYPVFSDIEVYEAPEAEDVAETSWAFAGGYVDDHEMTDEEAATILEMYGGTLRLEFPDANTANMVQGGGTMPGTFRFLNDGITMSLSFELQGTTYDYVAAFTYAGDADEDLVLILVSTAEPDMALYMGLDM